MAIYTWPCMIITMYVLTFLLNIDSYHISRASLVAQWVKRLPTMRETWVQSLGREDPLEKEVATHSSTLAWRIPWTEKPGRLQSMGSQRVGHDWVTFPFPFPTIFPWGFPNGSDFKESACNAGDAGLIPGSGRSPGEGSGNPLQYSCLGSPMVRGTGQGWRRVEYDWATKQQ